MSEVYVSVHNGKDLAVQDVPMDLLFIAPYLQALLTRHPLPITIHVRAVDSFGSTLMQEL